MADVVIEKLSKQHDRAGFDCGVPKLNLFLQQQARSQANQGFGVTWVAVEEGQLTILGYVTVSMGHIEFDHADPAVTARLPRYPIPVIRVGKLATDIKFQGRGIGSLLLAFAARMAISTADKVGCYALELEAADDNVFQYYLKKGFLPLQVGSLRLYQPVETLRSALEP